jgi:tripartite-type tricarboxylate transporter receptor subunit TctC
MGRRFFAAAALSLLASVIGSPVGGAPADTASFFKGRTVQLLIGFGPTGGYDTYARTLARHMGKHIPGNPTIVPQNMPGAGGFIAANNIYSVAPKDGTAMAIVPAGTLLAPLMGTPGARFDTTRFTFVGTPASETPVCVAHNGPHVKVRTVRDLTEKELVVGSTGPGAGPHTWPKALSALLGMKFRVVAGFPSIANVLLAMERGELDGVCTILDTVLGQRPDWLPNGKATILFHGGGAPNTALKDAPFAGDLAKTPEQRAAIEFLFAGAGLARPIIAPPDMVPDGARRLQAAFMATMQDPDFLADAKRQKLDVEARDGAYLTALVRKIYATPKPIVDRVAELIK